MVSMAVTLTMMAVVVTIFGLVSDSVSGSRATIEMSERLRAAALQLQQDLSGITVPTLPPRDPSANEGYLEYIEGAESDCYEVQQPGNQIVQRANMVEGDRDDVLMFTTRNPTQTFKQGPAESKVAEVVWFYFKPPGFTYGNLYRCVRLVGAGGGPASLGDLTKRENRLAHRPHDRNKPYVFPFWFDPETLVKNTEVWDVNAVRPENVVLSNVVGFDVRAYDPGVPVLLGHKANATDRDEAVVPGDLGYETALENKPVVLGSGAYVDLFFMRPFDSSKLNGASLGLVRGSSLFQGPGEFKSGLQVTAPVMPATFDTWSLHYEHNGIDEDRDGLVDQGTNGFDDNNNGIVDDVTERETMAPYPVALRGIQIKLRVYEPDSRQIREVTVVQDFLPE
jgi:hypothetical protein